MTTAATTKGGSVADVAAAEVMAAEKEAKVQAAAVTMTVTAAVETCHCSKQWTVTATGRPRLLSCKRREACRAACGLACYGLVPAELLATNCNLKS